MISVIIRVLNEGKFLDRVLKAVKRQKLNNMAQEIIIVDSGSTDDTLEISMRNGCKIVHIDKSQFSFGRSLNVGCEAASGEYLVFISGHCIPASDDWLLNLVQPLIDKTATYSYGRQLGNEFTRFSEHQIFEKYFPLEIEKAQSGFFCNNANAALTKSAWYSDKFNEEVTGLEDMELAKRLYSKGQNIEYVPSAPVFHIHEESWRQVRHRYEREALALQTIMPEVHVHFIDLLRYISSAIIQDAIAARKQAVFFGRIAEIFMFRIMQYYGTYRGNRNHRELSRDKKERYFYPKNK